MKKEKKEKNENSNCESLYFKYFKKIIEKEIKEEEDKNSW